ncbi:MAG: glycosyl transferase [Hyphomicrobiales bacterium]|nr:glycosyl transferase [Hyphomicrobiales bacterium]
MPRVDVIIPCYNYGRYLKQCVESVLTQTNVEVRVLILDDASPDDTPEIGAALVGADARVTFTRHVRNKGHLVTFNEGLEWASGDYLLLLSADDYLLPGALSRATLLMEHAPEVGFVFGRVLVEGGDGSLVPVSPFDGKAIRIGHLILSGAEFFERSGATNIVPTPTAVVRSTLQKRVGPYRLDLPHTSDLEMWLRLATHASVGFVDADQAVYRQHGANMSSAYAATMLPDIEHRKAAFDRFFSDSGELLPDADALRDRIYLKLAQSTVDRASLAFNNGNLELSDQLLQFSRSIHPRIVKSAPWLRLGIKRRIGVRGWRAISGLKRAVFERRQTAS